VRSVDNNANYNEFEFSVDCYGVMVRIPMSFSGGPGFEYQSVNRTS
jgi:hypothetical protein